MSGKRLRSSRVESGIDFALANGHAEAGAEVVLNWRDVEVLARSHDEIVRVTGATVHTCAFGVAAPEEVAAAAQRVESEIGPSRSS